jgi:hypothetical protein
MAATAVHGASKTEAFIEFSCDQCPYQMLTKSATSGRIVRCPECGAWTRVPGELKPTQSEIDLAIDTVTERYEQKYGTNSKIFANLLLVWLAIETGAVIYTFRHPPPFQTYYLKMPHFLFALILWISWGAMAICVLTGERWALGGLTLLVGLKVCWVVFRFMDSLNPGEMMGALIIAGTHIPLLIHGLWCLRLTFQYRRSMESLSQT